MLILMILEAGKSRNAGILIKKYYTDVLHMPGEKIVVVDCTPKKTSKFWKIRYSEKQIKILLTLI